MVTCSNKERKACNKSAQIFPLINCLITNVLIHSMNAKYRCPAKQQSQTSKSSQTIYNHLKGFGTLMAIENYTYELNS